MEYLACRNLARWIWATSAAKVLAVWKALLLWWRCFRPCLSRVLLFLFTLGIVLNRIALGEEERFGLRGSADLSLANTGIPYVNAQSPGTETDLSGQFILLGSARICNSLLAFYEGRLQHFEGISGSDPRHQSTHGQPLLQGYLRYTPRASWKLSIQAGRFGTPFGQFLSRNYPDKNPLFGSPLIYSYRTSLSASEVPQNLESLLYYRDRTRLPQSYAYANGSSWLPLIETAYPVGVMVFGSPRQFDYRFSAVNSSISNPQLITQSGQKTQWIAGGGWTIVPGLHVGASLSDGPYLNGSVNSQLPPGQTWKEFTQRAAGLDFDYSRGHFQASGEMLFTDFQAPNIPGRLGARGYYTEFQYSWTPRLFTAVRWNQLLFDRVTPTEYSSYRAQATNQGESSGVVGPRWDYNVNRLEVGFGFHITEKWLAKASYQANRTIDEQDPSDNIFAVQLVYSFDILSLFRFR